MTSKKYFYIIKVTCLLLYSIFTVSCTPYELYDLVKDITDSPKICQTGTTYQTEYRERGVYRDSKERIFQVIIDFENVEDVTYDVTAKDIAKLASIAINVLELSTKPKYEFVDNAYLYGLKSFHVIVTNTIEEFNYLNGSILPDNIVAYTTPSGALCWDDLKDEVNFDIVIKNTYSNEIYVLAHELSHIIAHHTYGDSDKNHINENVWYELGGNESIQGKILFEYEAETGLDPYGKWK